MLPEIKQKKIFILTYYVQHSDKKNPYIYRKLMTNTVLNYSQ